MRRSMPLQKGSVITGASSYMRLVCVSQDPRPDARKPRQSKPLQPKKVKKTLDIYGATANNRLARYLLTSFEPVCTNLEQGLYGTYYTLRQYFDTWSSLGPNPRHHDFFRRVSVPLHLSSLSLSSLPQPVLVYVSSHQPPHSLQNKAFVVVIVTRHLGKKTGGKDARGEVTEAVSRARVVDADGTLATLALVGSVWQTRMQDEANKSYYNQVMLECHAFTIGPSV